MKRVNPMNPESDLQLLSPNNITPESLIKVMRRKELSLPKEAHHYFNEFV